ncbi:hypothetical protein BC629DRAFT_1479789 [Irpex lacteus]|nr:hypothetical protein BC629DRAFT_1479789 [Irpex lacteus]
MELVPQLAYVVQNNHIYTKKPDILFDIPVHCGIASEAVAKSQGPPHWKNERMHCFASGTKISIRINWPGYLPSSHAINICDDTKEHNPITKAKLASNIVKVVRKVLEENSRRIQSQKGFEEWVISKDGSTGIQSSMVYLTKLRHVSEGSWQPELYVAWKA